MHAEFERWFEQMPLYNKVVYIYGRNIFFKDGGEYKLLIVQVAYLAWMEDKDATREIRHTV